MLKYLLIFLGLVSLAIGIVGIFFPVLPTTPFMLLSAALFIRSSDRLYRWLVSNRVFGRYIRDFKERGGMTAGGKLSAIALMWGMIALSSLMIGLNICLLALGAVGTIVMGAVIKTVK
jgi:uncharacterized membrane protein YbaN (DUF454 family)